MKMFALIFCALAFTAQAEVITQGGFGTDGATGESMPLETSVKDAAAVYKALNLGPNGTDKKEIVLEDGSQFECDRPYSGISRLNAGCQLTLRASMNAKVSGRNGLAGDLTFGGEMAKKLYEALPAGTARVGANTKSVANVKCVKTSGRGFPVKCTIKSMNVLQMDVEL